MHNFTDLQMFVVFFVEGIIFSFLFDFFRGIRINFKSGNIATLVEDFVFLTITSVLLTYTIIFISNGIIRIYIFIGLVLGSSLYFLTISKKCVIIFKNIIRLFRSFFTFLLKFVKKLGKMFKV